MSYDAPIAPTLFDLLARSWTLGGPVAEAVFNRDASAVAFVSAAGLAVAPIADPERPEARLRVAADTGRATISPRNAPPRPLAEASGAKGPVAAWGEKSFIAAGAKGGLVTVTPRGQVVPLDVGLAGPLAAIARHPGSEEIAAVAGAKLIILPAARDAPGLRSALPAPGRALAYSPDGRTLAVGCDGGLILRSGATDRHVAIPETPVRLSWSPNGAFLACGFDGPGFAFLRLANDHLETNPDYPTPVASFGWIAEPRAFVTSGAFRSIAWSLGPDGLADPLEAGRAALVIVDRLAASPTRPIVAAGYANGLVCLARVGLRDEMMLRADGAAVTALAFSPDGKHLAVGDAGGGAALIALPDLIFK
jgi:hypothetical protein